MKADRARVQARPLEQVKSTREVIMNEPLTATLRDGRTVTAKMYEGKPYALTYAQMSQATKAAEKQGAGWHVTGRRPYYVTKEA